MLVKLKQFIREGKDLAIVPLNCSDMEMSGSMNDTDVSDTITDKKSIAFNKHTCCIGCGRAVCGCG